MNDKTFNRPIPEHVVKEIKSILPDILASHNVIVEAKKQLSGNPTYICPNCKNGTGRNGTGISPQFRNGAWIYHCFKCDAAYDNIHLLAFHYNLNSDSDFREICQRACQEFNIHLETGSHSKGAKRNVSKNGDNAGEAPSPRESAKELALKEKERALIRSDIYHARATLESLPKTARRGLTLDTFRHFDCGYLINWTPPKSRARNSYAKPTHRLIIPSGDHYLARLVVTKDSLEQKEQKPIAEKMHAGTKFPFNFKSVSTETANIIVEGEIDAMSIWQATTGKYPVIATAGAAGYGEFVRLVKEKFEKSETKPRFIILFDPDKAGRDNSKKFCDELLSAQFPAVCHFLSDEESKIDANDILCNQGQDKLAELIDSICTTAQDNLKKADNYIKKELDRNSRMESWIKNYGEIEPETFAKLKESANYLQSLTTDKINATIASDSETLKAVAICNFYSFYREVAKRFIYNVQDAKVYAKRAVKKATADNPVDDTVIAIANIDLKEFKDEIRRNITRISKEHDHYTLQKQAEKSKVLRSQIVQDRQKKIMTSLGRTSGRCEIRRVQRHSVINFEIVNHADERAVS